MKILQIHNFFRQRGGEDYYVNILGAMLERKGHKVVRFFTDSNDINDFSLLKKLSLPLRMIHSTTRARQLQDLLQREKPERAIIHNLTPLLSPSLLALLKRNGIPVLKRLENYKSLCLNGLFMTNDSIPCEACLEGNFIPGVRQGCYQHSHLHSLGLALPEYFHRRRHTLLRYTDHFLAPSHFVRNKFLSAGFPAETITVQPNFLDFPLQKDITTSSGYALYLGRLSKEKGVLTLLKAFMTLPQLTLKIAGLGPMEKTLRDFVHTHGLTQVEFIGFLEGLDKREILKNALFTIFPSECYESFGYSVAESLACGVPVIVAAGGAAAELVHDGCTGRFFHRGDAQDLRQTVIRMLADPQGLKNMRHEALRAAAVMLDPKKNFTDFMKLLNRIGS